MDVSDQEVHNTYTHAWVHCLIATGLQVLDNRFCQNKNSMYSTLMYSKRGQQIPIAPDCKQSFTCEVTNKTGLQQWLHVYKLQTEKVDLQQTSTYNSQSMKHD